MTPVEGLGALAATADVLLCDVFGTIHDAKGPFPAAVEALRRFRAGGGTVLLLSNSAAPGPALARALAGLGVPEDCRDAILTSADVARDLLAGRGVRRAHHIGLPGERGLFEGLPLQLRSAAEAEIVVCTGCPDGPLPETSLAEAASRGLDLLCTNPDTEVVIPGGDGARVLRFAGLVAARYAALGGTVVSTGKPDAAIYAAATARIAAMAGVTPDPRRILAIGDTLHLDVAGAIGAGIRAVWIGGQAPAEAAEWPSGVRMPALAW